MKKITLSLVFLLAMVMSGYGQVSYDFGWEPTTASMGGWGTAGTSGSFSRNTTTPCTGSASVRANIYYGNSTTLTSPTLGTSNGGTVTLNFDYKVTNYSSNTTGAAATEFSITAEWASSLTGTWYPLGIIDELNHEVSATCATKTFTFSALPGDLFIRFKSQSIGSDADLYFYYDNISVTQGAAPNCFSPSVLTLSDLSSNSAKVSWEAVASASAGGYEFYSSNVNVAPTTAGTQTNNLFTTLTPLEPNTKYYFWIRSMCAAESSAWFGPFTFKTLCSSFSIPFTENFNVDSETEACWTVVNANADTKQWNLNYSSGTQGQSAVINTDGLDGANDDWLISPKITLTGNERLKFSYRAQLSSEPNDFMVKLSTTGNTPADFTTVLSPLTVVDNTIWATKTISLTSYTGDVFIAFHVPPGGLDGWILYIDDIIFELTPTVAPECSGEMVATIDEGCGNFATAITWASVVGADGYRLIIGTSASTDVNNVTEVQDVVLNVDLGTALSYAFLGELSTHYYYVVKPYAGDLLATGCFVADFTTQDDGCYCISQPTSVDGLGISNVQINEFTAPVDPVSYVDFTEDGAVNITQGLNAIMNVTLNTGWSKYNTNIWIDYNDNFTFETSELVYNGVEAQQLVPNPYVLNTTFSVPLTAQLGSHRMRIVSTDVLQTPANPCYNGSWGVTLEFLVNVLEAPTCLPPSAANSSNITANSAQINWVSTDTLFNIHYDFPGFTAGTIGSSTTGAIVTGLTGNSASISNLASQADYQFYIQTDCGNGGLSPWTGPYSFRTGCAAFGDFSEDFTVETSGIVPECWYTFIDAANTYASITTSSFSDNVQIYNSDDTNANLYLITPALTALPAGTHRIKFKAKSYEVGNSIILGTMTDPADPSTFTPKQTLQVTTELNNYSVAFLTATTDMHVAFKAQFGDIYQYVFVDDVVWETAPNCADVNAVNFGGATPFTADISWSVGGNETKWEYAYTSDSTVTDPTGLSTYEVLTTPSTTITGLQESTVYKVWVRASCGTTFGVFSDPITFLTACLPVTTFPWTEGFENLTSVGYDSFPPCWSKEGNDNGFQTSDSGTVPYTQPRSGSNYIRSIYEPENDYMWTPGFQLTAGVSYDFSFYMQGDGYTSWIVDVFQNSVQSSTGATQLGGTNSPSGPDNQSLQPYALVSNTFVPSADGIYYFALRVNNPEFMPNSIGFDDFRMEPTPTCAAPLPPTASNITITSATINWTAPAPAPAGGYDYYYSITNVAPNATTVPTGHVAAGITTVDLPADLVGSTVYRIYVRSVCTANDVSSWSDAGTFSTSCTNATLPYTIDFENATVPNLPLCTTSENVGTGSSWFTNSAPGYGFTSKVLIYEYSPDAANAWFYTNIVTLQAGINYSISYNYGNNSTSPIWGFEDLRVSYGTAANAAAMTTELANHPGITGATIQANSVTFTPAASGNYVFGFNVYSAPEMDTLFLDNIVIKEEDLGNTDFDANAFTAYPNPVKDVLNVSFTQDITNVTLYNLLGQQVLFMNMNANKGQVDMSSLTTGTYLVKVNSESGVKTIKVIKQ